MVVVAPARRKWAASGVVRQLAWFAAIGRNHVDLLVAIVLSGECDPLTIGGEPWEQLQARMGGQPDGPTSLNRGGPEIACVDESNAVVVDVGIAEKFGLRR